MKYLVPLKSLVPASLIVAASLLAGCNTVQGAGKDIERGGEKIQDAAVDVKKKL